jgi:curved DNA-binding protein CbpA
MPDPYLILGIDADADDAAVERAYVEAIKRCPPERDAERFNAVRQAHEQLRSRRDRLAHALFDRTPPGPEDILAKAGQGVAPGRPDRALIERLLRGEH